MTGKTTFVILSLLFISYGEKLPDEHPLKNAKIVPLPLSGPVEAEHSTEAIDLSTPEKATLSYLNLIKEEQILPKDFIADSPYNKTQSRKTKIEQSVTDTRQLLSFHSAAWKEFRHHNHINILKTIQNGDLAVCIFSVHNESVPLSYSAGTLPLIKKDHSWHPGPFLNSFDNMGLPFNGPTREQAKKLLSSASLEIDSNLGSLKKSRQQSLVSQISEQIKKNRGKTGQQLLIPILEGLRKKDPVSLTALIHPVIPDSSNSKSSNTPVEQNLATTLLALGMSGHTELEEQNKHNQLRSAAESTNIIIPVREEWIESDAIYRDTPPLFLNNENTVPPPSVQESNGISPSEQSNKILKHTLGVIKLDKLAPDRFEQSLSHISLFYICLYGPITQNKASCFLMRYDISVSSISVTNDDALNHLSALIKLFPQYYPSKEWPLAEDAAKYIIESANKADMTALLQSISPSFMDSRYPRAFCHALTLVRHLAISAQEPYAANKNERDSQMERLDVIYNPFSRPVTKAYLYYTPDGESAYVIADAPESSKTPGLGKIRFKLNKDTNGNWHLDVFPGTPNLLTKDATYDEYGLTRRNAKNKNKPTVNDHTPFLEACREHFFETMQKE